MSTLCVPFFLPLSPDEYQALGPPSDPIGAIEALEQRDPDWHKPREGHPVWTASSRNAWHLTSTRDLAGQLELQGLEFLESGIAFLTWDRLPPVAAALDRVLDELRRTDGADVDRIPPTYEALDDESPVSYIAFIKSLRQAVGVSIGEMKGLLWFYVE